MIEPVFEDDYVVVVNKRPNLLVVPAPGHTKPTLTDKVKDYLRNKSQTAFACHRLDKDTSGLVIYAKNRKAKSKIMEQFKEKQVTKKYLAVVQKKVLSDKLIIKKTIKPKGKPAKFAVTYCKTIKAFKDFSLLEVKPKTGRNNQIRIHLVQARHPIIGERKYTVAKRWPLKFKRVCLHSFFIKFRHPVSNDLVSLSCGIPQDIKEFLSGLGVRISLIQYKDNCKIRVSKKG